MTDEEFVRSVWDNVRTGWGRVRSDGSRTFHLILPVLWHEGLNVKFALTPEAAWCAAAEFTRDRQEEIRKLRREISSNAEWRDYYHKKIEAAVDDPRGLIAYIRSTVNDLCLHGRTLSRLEAELARLTQGMKPQPYLIQRTSEAEQRERVLREALEVCRKAIYAAALATAAQEEQEK